MKISRLLFILSLTIIVFSSCNSGNLSERVAAAEMAMAAEDVEMTRKLCDDIMSDSVARGSVTATELARLSILYMQLNERTDDHEAVDLAADCYREAFKANADSARRFYESLPVDEVKYIMTLSSIVHSMDNPHQLEDYPDESHEFADSLAAE
ncbi:MAG: hypothetical protein NC339_06990 [Muribaculaceae bacterium]|nr:hypothetical protein [Muribaculaceae bacterium]